MKAQAKNIVIAVLVLVIAVGGYWSWNYHQTYQKNVNKILNYSIYSSLNMTQHELLSIRTELKEYEGKQITTEEFQGIVEQSRDYFFYGDYTKKFDYLGERFAYSDYASLNSYITILSDAEPPSNDVEFHKGNLEKIIKLWAPLTIKPSGDYLEPTPQLKKVLEETNSLANDGLQQI